MLGNSIKMRFKISSIYDTYDVRTFRCVRYTVRTLDYACDLGCIRHMVHIMYNKCHTTYVRYTIHAI